MDLKAMSERLNSAWKSFDTGDIETSGTMYAECLHELSDDEHDLYTADVEAFCEIMKKQEDMQTSFCESPAIMMKSIYFCIRREW